MANTFLTSKQVAERLQCSVSTISRMVTAGRLIPAMKLDGLRGAMWFSEDDIDTLMQERGAA